MTDAGRSVGNGTAPGHPGCLGPMGATVKNLRRKLGDEADNPAYIFTRFRVGYRMPRGSDGVIEVSEWGKTTAKLLASVHPFTSYCLGSGPRWMAPPTVKPGQN